MSQISFGEIIQLIVSSDLQKQHFDLLNPEQIEEFFEEFFPFDLCLELQTIEILTKVINERTELFKTNGLGLILSWNNPELLNFWVNIYLKTNITSLHLNRQKKVEMMLEKALFAHNYTCAKIIADFYQKLKIQPIFLSFDLTLEKDPKNFEKILSIISPFHIVFNFSNFKTLSEENKKTFLNYLNDSF